MSDSGFIRVFVDPALGSAAALARRSVEQLLRISGWRAVEAEEPGAADLVYSPRGVEAFGAVLPSAGEAAWRNLATHFFLCGVHERDPQVHCSVDGIPDASIGRWGLLECPVVDLLSQRLAKHLTNAQSLPTPAPRWPRGREWAVCLTH